MPTLERSDLPPVVLRYLDLRESDNAAGAADLFASDGVVDDEGHTHTGRDEIRAWIDDTNAKYEYTITFLGAREEDGMIGVAHRLIGEFPGGQVDLEYQFRLNAAGEIEHLYFA